ncbi:hypothetical protein ACFLRV_00520 [Candidatus Bipolaricaulota bacterium]
MLDKLIKDHPVLLNRAPTLHRLSMQAFEPVLVDGEAIHIHPLICPPYNADFDGDQMAVHLPLSEEAIREARELMAAPRNILSPSDGEPISLPTQDPVYAYYYLTVEVKDGKGAGKAFRDIAEARKAQEAGVLELHSPIQIRIDGKRIETTLGRAELNRIFPESVRDYTREMNRSAIRRVVRRCYHEFGWEKAAEVLDDLKDLGFKYATQAGLTISLKDCLIPDEKEGIVRASQASVQRIETMYRMGLSTEDERKQSVIRIWRRTVDEVEAATMSNLKKHRFNPVYGIVTSGARGGPDQVKQLCGMRGPMAGPSGEIIERPVISNFREGLDMMEYFISTHGGRKGAADTALKTADSGYLTRRLVDASSDTITTELDCGTSQGIDIDPLWFSKTEVMESIDERIYGRVSAEPVVDPASGEILVDANQWISQDVADHLGRLECELSMKKPAERERMIGTKSVAEVKNDKTNRVLVKADELLTPRHIDALTEGKVKTVRVRPRIVIRSPMTCETANGICQLCYGFDMSNHQPVQLGTAVGVIAAQSVGEPGTQLTMRTFHTGGVAGDDITQGLPRAEELFEARKTMKSGEAGISPLDGYITNITPTSTGDDQIEVTGEIRTARLPVSIIRAEAGEQIEVGTLIDSSSPCAGEVYILDGDDGSQELFITDASAGDRSYVLPIAASPKVKDGDRISEGDALTERFNIDGITADRNGVVQLPEDEDRLIALVDDDGGISEYEIPFGARLMVKAGAKVKEGDQLTSRSKPVFVAAEAEGTVLVLADRIVVFNPDGDNLRMPLTSDLYVTKRHGATVKSGEAILALEIAHKGEVVVESITKRKGIATVHLQPKSVVKIDKAITVRVGDKVEEGDLLTKGVVAPHTLLETAGVNKARQYLLNEIHKVYKQQGVDINDKHLEVIIRQILNNVKIIDRGDARFLLGDSVTLEEFRKEIRELTQLNQEAERLRQDVDGEPLAEDISAGGHIIATSGESLTQDLMARASKAGIAHVFVTHGEETIEVPMIDKRYPDGERELLRISRAALQTKGWLSAASFQRTTKVLSEAALRGEVDDLSGLKPSIIVGKRIPSGTNFKLPGLVSADEVGEADAEELLAAEVAAMTGSESATQVE